MNQTEKRAKVQRIFQELNDDLSTNTLSDPQRLANLEQLKIYGRDPNGADAIYCREGLVTLSRYAFGTYASTTVQEALRVIANALLLQPSLQAALIELNGIALIAKLYHNQDDDFEFLGARILFLCTYAAKADFEDAFAAHLFESIEAHLARHATLLGAEQGVPGPMAMMAMNETTKLIFNLNNKCPNECKSLAATVPNLCVILQHCRDAAPPLDPPTGSILNALACLDFGAVPARSNDQEAADQHQDLLKRLVDILTRSLQHYKPIQLDTIALSLITVLRMLYDTSSADVKAEMQTLLFPADNERDLPLGQSSSLASQLLRLTTSPGLGHLPEAISNLMFEMSDKDAGAFVKNIGYGYAAGYLMTHKIPIPESIQHATTIGSSTDRIPINPVTGQRLDKESAPDMPDMTPEEKEREAERLFVLFERLKATGVVNAENPVKKAMEERRLEEISDADSD